LKRYARHAQLDEETVSPHILRHTFGRPFGRLVNTSQDVARWQERAFSPWRPREPRRSGLVSVQGTRASCEGETTPQKANVQKGWEGLAG
jgi:hypothetical protein